MELIGDIINELANIEKSVHGCLLKTKVLASRIKNAHLNEWVNHELNGYPSIEGLPDYRRDINGVIQANFINGNMKYTNKTISVANIDSDLELINFTDSISTIEQVVNDCKSPSLNLILSPRIERIIEKDLQIHNPYLHLVSASRVVSVSSVSNIIAQVRNRLLDFMLEIDSQYGSLTELKNDSDKNVTRIMHQTIINTNGDGNVVTNGSENEVTANIKIDKSNKEQLKDVLRKNNVDDSDVLELLEIIDTEDHNAENKSFGTKTNNWFKKMLGKSLDGSWQVAIGAAGNILATAIQQYLGFIQ